MSGQLISNNQHYKGQETISHVYNTRSGTCYTFVYVFNFFIGFLIQITNNTPDMAEIRDLKVETGGWWQPRLPMLLSGQGGAAYGEVYMI